MEGSAQLLVDRVHAREAIARSPQPVEEAQQVSEADR